MIRNCKLTLQKNSMSHVRPSLPVGIEMEIFLLEREKKKSAAVIAATAKVYLATHFLDLDMNDKRPQA